MSERFDFWELIALAGGLHGLFLGMVLWSHARGNRIANRLLGTLILLYSLKLLEIVAYWTRWLESFPHLWGATFFLPYLYGVLLGGYLRAGADDSFQLRKKHLLHWIPFFLCLLLYAPFYLSSSQSKLAMLRAGYPEQRGEFTPSLVMLIFWGLQFAHFLIYFRWCWRFLSVSRAGSEKRSWMRLLLAGFAVTFGAWFSYGMAVAWGIPYARSIDYVATLAMTLTIYGIGYAGLTRPEFFLGAANGKRVARYQNSSLGEADRVRYQALLTRLMEDRRPFTDSELRLDDLASMVGLTPHEMSQLINQRFQQNFNDFINRYRVEEAKRLLADPNREHETVLSLAFEAGFNNKTSFNQAFKKYAAMTPSDFRARALTSLPRTS